MSTTHEDPAESRRRTAHAATRRIRTILADDNEGFLDAARAFLEAHQIPIVGEARTGREALALVEALKPDLLLLDLEMPELHGLEVLRQIMARRASPDALPRVVVVTLHEQEEYRAAVVNLGADGFIAKREFATALMPLIRRLFVDDVRR